MQRVLWTVLAVALVYSRPGPVLAADPARQDGRSIAKLRWVSPHGELPGTYAQYLRQHPLAPLPLPGQPLVKPQPLFAKLDDSVVERETARLGQAMS